MFFLNSLRAECSIYAANALVKYAIIGSGNGLLPNQGQAIMSTNAGILVIAPSGTFIGEI